MFTLDQSEAVAYRTAEYRAEARRDADARLSLHAGAPRRSFARLREARRTR